MSTHATGASTAPSAGGPLKARRGNLRWMVVGMCFLGTSINYLDRANISIAMPDIVKEFGISHTVEGLVLGAFFWTYALFQLPAGHFIDKLGARVMYTFAVVWWSVFTALTAVSTGFASLFGFRLGLGVGESAAYPANAKVVSKWFPKRERALATSIYDSGARFGSAIALPIVAFIIAGLGWRASFVITGMVGVIWAIGWAVWYRDPRRKAGLRETELRYIEEGGARADSEQSPEDAASAPQLRWRDLFRYRTVWGMMIGFFCLNFVIYFFITWFPTYLTDARGFSLLGTGIYGTIPAIVAIFGGWLGGWVSDRIYDRTGDLNKARKICLVGGMLFSSVIALAVIVPSAGMALFLLSVSYASLTFAAASIWSLPADVSPTEHQVASLGGIQNFASNLAGVGSPFFIGALYDATGSFVIPLVVVGGIALVGAVAYAVIIKRVEPLAVLRRDSDTVAA